MTTEMFPYHYVLSFTLINISTLQDSSLNTFKSGSRQPHAHGIERLAGIHLVIDSVQPGKQFTVTEPNHLRVTEMQRSTPTKLHQSQLLKYSDQH